MHEIVLSDPSLSTSLTLPLHLSYPPSPPLLPSLSTSLTLPLHLSYPPSPPLLPSLSTSLTLPLHLSYPPSPPLLPSLSTSLTLPLHLPLSLDQFGAITPLEPRLAKKLQDPLTTLIHSTSAMSLLFECVMTVISGMPKNVNLMQLCVSKLRLFVEDSDQNCEQLFQVQSCTHFILFSLYVHILYSSKMFVSNILEYIYPMC